MNYTYKVLLRSTQIAYYDINDIAIREVAQEKRENGILDSANSYTLKDLFNYSDTFRNSIYISIRESLGLSNDIDVSTREQALSFVDLFFDGDESKRVAISEVYDIIEEIEHGDLGNWKLVSYVFNDDIGVPGIAGKLTDQDWLHENFSPSGDGLCAYVFETADDSAIVAFRGSQPLDNVDIMDFVSDWLAADVGLALENDETVQQKSTEQYIKDYVNVLGYDHYAFAGHSLGGNLYPRLNNKIIQSAA